MQIRKENQEDSLVRQLKGEEEEQEKKEEKKEKEEEEEANFVAQMGNDGSIWELSTPTLLDAGCAISRHVSIKQTAKGSTRWSPESLCDRLSRTFNNSAMNEFDSCLHR